MMGTATRTLELHDLQREKHAHEETQHQVDGEETRERGRTMIISKRMKGKSNNHWKKPLERTTF